jgi:hypothetical protein
MTANGSQRYRGAARRPVTAGRSADILGFPVVHYPEIAAMHTARIVIEILIGIGIAIIAWQVFFRRR